MSVREILKNLFINKYRIIIIFFCIFFIYLIFNFLQSKNQSVLDIYIFFFLIPLFLFLSSLVKEEISKCAALLLIPFLLITFIFELFLGSWSTSEIYVDTKKLRDTKIIQNNIWYKSEEDKKIEIFLNRLGFRGKLKNDSIDDLDIITIGGSTSVQSTITDGKTFQDILIKLFKNELNKNLYILNAAEDGHSSLSHIHSLNNRLKKIEAKPKYFLFFIGANEGMKAKHFDRSWNIKNKLILKIYNSSFTIKKILEARVYLGTLITDPKKFQKWHLNGYLPFEKELKNENYVNFKKDENYESQLRESLKLELEYTRKNILILTKIVEDYYKAKAIFVTQRKATSFLEDNGIKVFNRPIVDSTIVGIGKEYDTKVNYYFPKIISDNIMRACQENVNNICINLHDELNLKNTDYHDFAHYKPSGSYKIGKYLFEKLKNEIK